MTDLTQDLKTILEKEHSNALHIHTQASHPDVFTSIESDDGERWRCMTCGKLLFIFGTEGDAA